MSTLLGENFNKLYCNKIFYKRINLNYKHFDFTYKHGLNIDHIKFNPMGKCNPGGLYFSDIDKILLYIYTDCYICKVTIPDDAYVYIEDYKFKADRIFLDLENKVKIRDFYIWNDNEFCCKAVKEYGWPLKFINIEFQTKELCETAINKYGGKLLEYICDKFHTEELYKLAVQKDGIALQFVKTPFKTQEICLMAVKEYWWAIRYVDEIFQTEEICLMALEKNIYLIKFIYKSRFTEKICNFIIKQNSVVS